PSHVAFKKQIMADIESGKLRTAEQIVEAWNEKTRAVAAETEAIRRKAAHDPVARRFFTAWTISRRYMLVYYSELGTSSGIFVWSRRLAEAEIARHENDREHVDVSADHLDRVRDVQFDIRLRTAAGRLGATAYLTADYFLAEAELLHARARFGNGRHTQP